MQQGTGFPGADEMAFAAFYRGHVTTLLNYIRRYVPTREDAEDVLVDVFLAAYEQHVLATFSEDEQLAWLRRVAYHKCVDLLRRQRRHPSLALESVSETLYEPEERSPESLVLRADEQTLLRHHLAELPAPQQAILCPGSHGNRMGSNLGFYGRFLNLASLSAPERSEIKQAWFS